ncbi:bi-domain-containing oxidoreductase [Sporosarcina sp. Marseille-Q4063]|uniref:bi-domain-containing oxidoreductase n=1 Tax=Sporosarcina sp. Marseille-Q4063 TaxID=2810514 RepID=UPI001BB02555|nr:bi-domain-containing oxidoreductase [Sporosarcina sp. Marseille-Q4063]QUW21250.1 bi-domain-containing oxidoreductase [Sporosarcina sp. Marseille-Q4063]
MKQVIQSLNNGETKLSEHPMPTLRPGVLLIQTVNTVVSVGTEKMLVDFGKSNYLKKAQQQPEKVKQVIDKVRTDGLQPTINAVRTKLDQPIALGYSNAGIVIAVGKDVKNFNVGDRVISNGSHAEVVSVPENLCAKIPDGVSYDEAAFTVISSIGLQGIRLAEPTLGETVVVTGLGLIGLLTVQLLKAHGCNVIASDFDQRKVDLAKSFGADAVNVGTGIDIVDYVNMKTKGRGADAVLITASTQSSDPISQAARMSRQRGRIILVGVTGLELNRSEFYEKELSFQVSCSYGPGRYDLNYEEKGQDYPIGFVRWTEQRNFEAILDMMSDKKLDVSPLITHRYKFNNAVDAYSTLSEDKNTIGIVLEYESQEIDIEASRSVTLNSHTTSIEGIPTIGIIGAGNFTNQTLLPAMNRQTVKKHTIVSSGGMTSVHVGQKYDFERASTEANHVFKEPAINVVFITTRHNSHAQYVKEGLSNQKHVFVEKPLCLTRAELEEIKEIEHDKILMVGFNRRFAPHVIKMKELLATVSQPKSVLITVNAGAIPADHWTQDLDVGGGRIIGEGCHFIDLARHLVGHKITGVQAMKMDTPGEEQFEDKVVMQFSFEDGSIASIQYLANGDKAFPKERVEVFAGNKVLSLDNFKTLTGHGWSGFSRYRTRTQDKGHANGIKAFLDGIKEGESPIPLEEIFEVTEATFDVVDQIRG